MLTNDTDSLTGVVYAITGGMFRLRLTRNDGPGRRDAEVIDDAGTVIGTAYDYIYGGRGFSVWTKPFAGFVPLSQIEFV